jgi:hypothetical protein
VRVGHRQAPHSLRKPQCSRTGAFLLLARKRMLESGC